MYKNEDILSKLNHVMMISYNDFNRGAVLVLHQAPGHLDPTLMARSAQGQLLDDGLAQPGRHGAVGAAVDVLDVVLEPLGRRRPFRVERVGRTGGPMVGMVPLVGVHQPGLDVVPWRGVLGEEALHAGHPRRPGGVGAFGIQLAAGLGAGLG